MENNRQPAVWHLLENVQSEDGTMRSVYLSEGGAIKITQHTDRGEQQRAMFPGSSLADVLACVSVLPKVFEAYKDASQDINAAKQRKKDLARLEREKQREAEKAILSLHALQLEQKKHAERLRKLGNFTEEEIDLIVKKRVG